MKALKWQKIMAFWWVILSGLWTYSLGKIKKTTKGWNLWVQETVHIGLEIVYSRMCSAIFSVGVSFLMNTRFFWNKIFLIGAILFFNGPLKHHTEYLFNLFTCVGLTFRGPQIPYVFSGLMNFRLICACLGHLYFTLRYSTILLLQVLLKTQNCVSDILFQL